VFESKENIIHFFVQDSTPSKPPQDPANFTKALGDLLAMLPAISAIQKQQTQSKIQPQQSQQQDEKLPTESITPTETPASLNTAPSSSNYTSSSTIYSSKDITLDDLVDTDAFANDGDLFCDDDGKDSEKDTKGDSGANSLIQNDLTRWSRVPIGTFRRSRRSSINGMGKRELAGAFRVSARATRDGFNSTLLRDDSYKQNAMGGHSGGGDPMLNLTSPILQPLKMAPTSPVGTRPRSASKSRRRPSIVVVSPTLPPNSQKKDSLWKPGPAHSSRIYAESLAALDGLGPSMSNSFFVYPLQSPLLSEEQEAVSDEMPSLRLPTGMDSDNVEMDSTVGSSESTEVPFGHEPMVLASMGSEWEVTLKDTKRKHIFDEGDNETVDTSYSGTRSSHKRRKGI
jgi:hypothetical protein